VQTVKNVRDKVDCIAWMDTRRLFEKHGMELCRQRVRELVELCGKDKIVIQIGMSSQEFSPYPKEFMAMCREEGVGIFFLYVSKPVLESAQWKEFVRQLP
jgi:histidinol phosphatase-like PHP family hydrolase